MTRTRRRRSPDNLFKSIEDETPLGNLAESRWSRKRCSEEAARSTISKRINVRDRIYQLCFALSILSANVRLTTASRRKVF
ncbi:hypothetical protein HZH66_013497 [Vespula vulgaris]|uniref:Uncharacterized protein n=1 Tax=Vespula vulgaris TaxID=7454 RepID=A0A834MR51_VESVU|nr:hypothetical protein HZH66_013497 [Vespula vulgaris]